AMRLPEGELSLMINYRYEPIRELGRGGGGTVLLAHDIVGDCDIALKILNPAVDSSGSGTEAAIRTEFSTLCNLVHPDLLAVYDFGKIIHVSDGSLQPGSLFYTMEYFPGRDAKSFVDSLSTP